MAGGSKVEGATIFAAGLEVSKLRFPNASFKAGMGEGEDSMIKGRLFWGGLKA
jgi:hypothetical protein